MEGRSSGGGAFPTEIGSGCRACGDTNNPEVGEEKGLADSPPNPSQARPKRSMTDWRLSIRRKKTVRQACCWTRNLPQGQGSSEVLRKALDNHMGDWWAFGPVVDQTTNGGARGPREPFAATDPIGDLDDAMGGGRSPPDRSPVKITFSTHPQSLKWMRR